MDFITHLPKSQGKSVILVIVDRLSKYAHFCPLPAEFSAPTVANCFAKEICRLHSVPTQIVSDRDPVFMSQFWQDLFHLQGTILSHSSAYHPQSDGQTEVPNRILEDYLRCYVTESQSNWVQLLPWAEWQYNTSWQSSIQLTPYEAVYGQSPPMLLDYEDGTGRVEEVGTLLKDRTQLIHQLRANIARAQHRMTQQANKHRRDVEFQVGDWVYLRLQPYRQSSVHPRRSPKLAKRFFGPFKVPGRIGRVAYRLELPVSSKIHDVFHVSLLRKCMEQPPFDSIAWPESFSNGHPLLQPKGVRAKRQLLRGSVPIQQVLVQWSGEAKEHESWEEVNQLLRDYPNLRLEVESVLGGVGNDAVEDLGREDMEGTSDTLK